LVQRIRRWHPRDGIVVNERFLTPEQIPTLFALTPTIFTWGVVDLARAVELVEAGVSGLIIDDLDLIAQIRQRYPAN
jgi:glycerophosphoryl diester phosphodiesterase